MNIGTNLDIGQKPQVLVLLSDLLLTRVMSQKLVLRVLGVEGVGAGRRMVNISGKGFLNDTSFHIHNNAINSILRFPFYMGSN